MKYFLSLSFILIWTLGNGQSASLQYFLGSKAQNLDQTIPTPAQVLGQEVGDWHLRHDQILKYLELLAEKSPRITLSEYGRTFENKRLILLHISSPENIAKLDQLRQKHTDWVAGKVSDNTQVPLVVWLGYSVHGDEPSGSNSSVLMAYYLAASQDPTVLKWLNEGVILLDPSINPDGLDRFANWVNANKSFAHDADPNHRDHHQLWPTGRTNHYWFDLNRDWLMTQLPESQGRIKKYQIWQPNVLTDHHEMGQQRTFFFQPGVPSRKNPSTPDANVRLTEAIAAYHGKALDEIGTLYYSQEGFDDFYYGKGSTYPDVQGAVGILFEQASIEGHKIRNSYGEHTFTFAVRNHLTTAISTVTASFDLKKRLLDHQQQFFKTAQAEATKDRMAGYIFGDEHNNITNYEFLKLLQIHQIQVFEIARDVNLKGQNFKQGKAYFVPFQQRQYRLIKAIFETQTKFKDSIFYDVSTWTLPLAFNLPYQKVSKALNIKGVEVGNPEFPSLPAPTTTEPVAFAFESKGYYAQRAIYRLMQAGFKVIVSQKPTTLTVSQRPKRFDYGTLFVPLGIQVESKRATLSTLIAQITREDGVEVFAVERGLANKGIDLGSPNMQVLEMPKIILVVGKGVSQYEAGEVWHLLDQRFKIPVTMVRQARLDRVNLDRYNTMIMVNGNYQLSKSLPKIKAWLSSQKATLITTKSATQWLANQKLLGAKVKSYQAPKTQTFTYANLQNDKGSEYLGGSIFKVKIDLTHPLGWGYRRAELPLFRNHTRLFEKPSNGYAAPINYTAAPLLSGYIPPNFTSQISKTPAVVFDAHKQSKIISFLDNPNFRAFWYGSNKLFMNAIFFGQLISTQSD